MSYYKHTENNELAQRFIERLGHMSQRIGIMQVECRQRERKLKWLQWQMRVLYSLLISTGGVAVYLLVNM